MNNRALELAEEFGLLFLMDDEPILSRMLSFYEAAKKDGMIEMRERAAVAGFDTAQSDENACEVATSIRALEIE